MGAIILFVCISIILTFLLGVLFAIINDTFNTNYESWFLLTVFGLILSVGFSIASIQRYYEKKEYSSVKYELKKKVITTEEDNIIEQDTIYMLKRKSKG